MDGMAMRRVRDRTAGCALSATAGLDCALGAGDFGPFDLGGFGGTGVLGGDEGFDGVPILAVFLATEDF
jgi:hypothetical protein